MKPVLLLCVISNFVACTSYGQETLPVAAQSDAITRVINQYSAAREKSDTLLLKKILTTQVDQLVSSGEWRYGIAAAVEGMLKSTAGNPGTRTLTVENIRLLNPTTALVDCQYRIQQSNGNLRNMWSSFILVYFQRQWKISAIRNMLPTSE